MPERRARPAACICQDLLPSAQASCSWPCPCCHPARDSGKQGAQPGGTAFSHSSVLVPSLGAAAAATCVRTDYSHSLLRRTRLAPNVGPASPILRGHSWVVSSPSTTHPRSESEGTAVMVSRAASRRSQLRAQGADCHGRTPQFDREGDAMSIVSSRAPSLIMAEGQSMQDYYAQAAAASPETGIRQLHRPAHPQPRQFVSVHIISPTVQRGRCCAQRSTRQTFRRRRPSIH